VPSQGEAGEIESGNYQPDQRAQPLTMAPDYADPRPLYQRIADDLRDAIRRADLTAGQALPSERELMARYATTRGTVRRAFSVLVGEGLVVAHHGRGVFVRQQPTVHRLGHQRHSAEQRRSGMGPFTAEARRQGQRPDQQLLEVVVVPAPGFVSERLNLEPGALALVRRHVLLADDIPMQLADSWFSYDLVIDTPIARAEKIPKGVHAVLEHDLGYQLDHFIEDLSFRMPNPDEARQLRLSPGVPVVRLLNTLYDATGTPLQVTDFILAGDRHILQYKIPAH
jgi:GntR family transcriptional regulator